MDTILFLVIVGFIHLSFYFFNTIFVSCMHLPYLVLLENIGIDVQFLRIKWFTTAFNRSLMKWGLNRSKFWAAWFNTGMIVTLLLLPISIILLLKMTFEAFVKENSVDPNEIGSGETLEIMIPGVTIPFSEIGYYIIALLLSSSVHEFGHAMAAVKEDVRFLGTGMILFFILPVAYVNICDSGLSMLGHKSRLRILCAGIWHNVILTGLAMMIAGLITISLKPFFIQNTGVYIKHIYPNSGLLGPVGLSNGDVVHKINDCSVHDSTSWRYCIQQAIQLSTPGYCVNDNIVRKSDKSSFLQNDANDMHNCCDKHYKNNGHLCFEHLGIIDMQAPHSSSVNFCLPIRAIISSSHNYCQSNDHCSMASDYCVKPKVTNSTKVVQIQRYGGKDVIFHGNPLEIYYTIELSDWVPRYSFFSPQLPEVLILLCKYVALFSSGIAIVNVIPCFFFDGQHIISILIDQRLKNTVKEQSIRSVIAFVVMTVFSILLIGNVFIILFNKL
ncbi:hypothetical protein TKK_0007019 [Trichogramma kaykai]